MVVQRKQNIAGGANSKLINFLNLEYLYQADEGRHKFIWFK